MTDAIADLNDKQREALRLIGRGHDAKSCARALDRSVHTINERLRDARRTLGVSSSREAARMLLAHESADPENRGDESFGGAIPHDGTEDVAARHADRGDRRRSRRTVFAVIGVIAMSILIALALGLSTPAAESPAIPPQTAARDAALEAAARRWLELTETGDYAGSYAASAESFRAANTLAGWQDAAAAMRQKFGVAVSRELVGVESVPTPPDGNEILIFQTKYAKGGDKVETVALVREGGAWKVVGVYVE